MAPQNAWYQYHCREMDTVLPVYMQQPRRPIQNNINLDVPHAGSSSSNPLVDLREKCKSCNSDVPQTLLRQHVKTCVSRRQLRMQDITDTTSTIPVISDDSDSDFPEVIRPPRLHRCARYVRCRLGRRCTTQSCNCRKP
ncbi:uncharacterized protein [Apostichopus japonicus]|uniref:uncharacterized protein isoform X1 n=1 Tax=Stichopus japonicus TaxID=307972 RepID=UPI003AB50A7E